MIWKSKDAPIYVFLDDMWQREGDKALFRPDVHRYAWVSEEEVVEWTKKTRVMKHRDR